MACKLMLVDVAAIVVAGTACENMLVCNDQGNVSLVAIKYMKHIMFVQRTYLFNMVAIDVILFPSVRWVAFNIVTNILETDMALQ